MIGRAIRWLSNPGDDPALAVAQVRQMQRQIPLLYGLLLLNASAIAITHFRSAPKLLTLSLPAILLLASIVRMAHWVQVRGSVPTPAEAKRQLQTTTMLAGVLASGYVLWALLLAPYGGAFEQAHVALFISTTVIGCIFCLMHAPQAATLVAVSVIPPYFFFFLFFHESSFAPLALNVTFVLIVLLRVLFRSFDSFRRLVHSQGELSLQTQQMAELAQQNRALAMTDSLTSLPNRRFFCRELELLAGRREHGCRPFTVMLIDLDCFKPINDTHGHQTGDQVLIEIAGRLQEAAEPGRVCRLGGDEFGVLLEMAPADAERIARRVVRAVGVPLIVDDLRLTLAASIGLAGFPHAGGRASDLFDRADYALYHSKRSDRGGISVFTPEMEVAIRADRRIESALLSADLEQELDIKLQPIIDLSTGRVHAAEVLVRWTSPIIGSVPPDQFIPIAERTSIIHTITLIVLDRALQFAADAAPDVALSINMSTCDLSSVDTIDKMIGMIDRAGLASGRIWFEVTETAAMRNFDAAIVALERLRATGARIALDDFGTGHSSLSAMHRLPLDTIKVDRSFILALDDPSSRSIAEAIVGLCRTLGMDCVAEGVESKRQLARLQEMRCDLAQGYLFAQPLDRAKFRALVAEQSPCWVAVDEPRARLNAA